ncbi:DUF1294 domain-containing protein [Candidatus Gracilibacteria bacterium]|nr:DUF1294 domain-containing protein [Candidatus Gracilibacteria bacterium]
MLTYIIVINLLTYTIMWVDKVKSIYNWWRVSEKTLWTFALFGGAFGIWLGMQNPLYHKAGKNNFRIWIPIICIVWLIFTIIFFS